MKGSAMSNTKEETVVLIENWSLVLCHDDDKKDQSRLYFQGCLFGHPKLPNGFEARTSQIIQYDEKEKVFVCKSRNYRLGTVNPHYEELFPNALKRILEEIKHVNLE